MIDRRRLLALLGATPTLPLLGHAPERISLGRVDAPRVWVGVRPLCPRCRRFACGYGQRAVLLAEDLEGLQGERVSVPFCGCTGLGDVSFGVGSDGRVSSLESVTYAAPWTCEIAFDGSCPLSTGDAVLLQDEPHEVVEVSSMFKGFGPEPYQHVKLLEVEECRKDPVARIIWRSGAIRWST